SQMTNTRLIANEPARFAQVAGNLGQPRVIRQCCAHAGDPLPVCTLGWRHNKGRFKARLDQISGQSAEVPWRPATQWPRRGRMDGHPPWIAILFNAAWRNHAIGVRAPGMAKVIAAKIAHLIGFDKALAGNDHMLVVDGYVRMMLGQIERPAGMHLQRPIKAAERSTRLLLRQGTMNIKAWKPIAQLPDIVTKNGHLSAIVTKIVGNHH